MKAKTEEGTALFRFYPNGHKRTQMDVKILKKLILKRLVLLHVLIGFVVLKKTTVVLIFFEGGGVVLVLDKYCLCNTPRMLVFIAFAHLRPLTSTYEH